MKLDEAMAWLRGERSMANAYRSAAAEPHEREVSLAKADAAMTEQAYWIVRAHREGLVADPRETMGGYRVLDGGRA